MFLSCVPNARLDPCTGCPGACSDAFCELADLEGDVRSLAAAKTGVFACTTTDTMSTLFRITRDAKHERLATIPGACVRVVVAGPFVYVGVTGTLGAVYRVDQTGAGLHVEFPQPGLTDFAVESGVVSMAVGQRSTPITVSPGTGVRVAMAGLDQISEVGALVGVGDGRLAWSIPSRREALVTSTAGDGGPVFDGPARDDQLGLPFLLAADRDGVVVADGDRVLLLSVDGTAFPESLGEGLSQPSALALTPTEAVVADLSGVRAFPRDGEGSTQLTSRTVSGLTTSETEIFAARGSTVAQIRRP